MQSFAHSVADHAALSLSGSSSHCHQASRKPSQKHHSVTHHAPLPVTATAACIRSTMARSAGRQGSASAPLLDPAEEHRIAQHVSEDVYYTTERTVTRYRRFTYSSASTAKQHEERLPNRPIDKLERRCNNIRPAHACYCLLH